MRPAGGPCGDVVEVGQTVARRDMCRRAEAGAVARPECTPPPGIGGP